MPAELRSHYAGVQRIDRHIGLQRQAPRQLVREQHVRQL